MNQEIETDKWKIWFKQPTDKPLDESHIELIFRLKSDQTGVRSISKEDLERVSTLNMTETQELNLSVSEQPSILSMSVL